MTGAEFFASHHGSKEKVQKLRALEQEQQLAWEGEQVSEHSLSVVGNDEVVIRAILDPTHLEPDGQIKPNAFDDAFTHGLSVHRKKYIELQKIFELQNARVEHFNNKKPPEKPHRKLAGHVNFEVNQLRSVLHENMRCIAVYDTANAEDISHAEVCGLLDSNAGKRSIRATLFNLSKTQYHRI